MVAIGKIQLIFILLNCFVEECHSPKMKKMANGRFLKMKLKPSMEKNEMEDIFQKFLVYEIKANPF